MFSKTIFFKKTKNLKYFILPKSWVFFPRSKIKLQEMRGPSHASKFNLVAYVKIEVENYQKILFLHVSILNIEHFFYLINNSFSFTKN